MAAASGTAQARISASSSFYGAPAQTPVQVCGRTTEKIAVKKKTCSHCGQRKEPAEFPRNKRTRDQAGSWCRACVNEARRVVPKWVYLDGVRQLNPSKRPKSKVR